MVLAPAPSHEPGRTGGARPRKVHQVTDACVAGRRFASRASCRPGTSFLSCRRAGEAPRRSEPRCSAILRIFCTGRWIAFGHLPLQVETPPHWHKDYLAGVDLATDRPGFKIASSTGGQGGHQTDLGAQPLVLLVRLAQAAYVLGDPRRAQHCLAWLEDWVRINPPYYGWNWTSGLESGLRLIQFVWIDALVSALFSGAKPTGPIPS